MRVPNTTLQLPDGCQIGWRDEIDRRVVEVGIVSPLGTVTVYNLVGQDKWIPTKLMFPDGYTIDLTEGETL